VSEQEEARFRETIERGLGLLDERFERMSAAGQTTLAGADAFQLYDTYGFPLDLTQVISAERGYEVDVPGYEAALQVARERSEFKGESQAVEAVYREALRALADNPDAVSRGSSTEVRFTGYDQTDDRSTIAVILVGGALVPSAGEGTDVEIVTPRTPFYGEAGGQVGDRGVIETETGVVEVSDVQKPVHGLSVHRGKVRSGTISRGQRRAAVGGRPRSRRHTAKSLPRLICFISRSGRCSVRTCSRRDLSSDRTGSASTSRTARR